MSETTKSLCESLTEFKNAGNSHFIKGTQASNPAAGTDMANAVSSYSDGLVHYVEATNAMMVTSGEGVEGHATTEGAPGDDVLQAMGVLEYPDGRVSLEVEGNTSPFSEDIARVVVTLLSNRAASLLGLVDDTMRDATEALKPLLTAPLKMTSQEGSTEARLMQVVEDHAADAYRLLTGAVEDTKAATNIIRAHYAWSENKPCSIVPVAEPLVPAAQRAKIMFRRARALQKMCRLERFLAKLLLLKRGLTSSSSDAAHSSGCGIVGSLTSEEFITYTSRMKAANIAAMDALTLFRKAHPLAAAASSTDEKAIAQEIQAFRKHDMFPSAAYVHPMIDKVLNPATQKETVSKSQEEEDISVSAGAAEEEPIGGITTHGVGLLVAEPSSSSSPSTDSLHLEGQTTNKDQPEQQQLIQRGTLLLREFPTIHCKNTANQTYQQRFAAAFQEMMTVSEHCSSLGGSGVLASHLLEWSSQATKLDQLLSLHFDDVPFFEAQREEAKKNNGGNVDAPPSGVEHLQFVLCDIWRRNAMKIAENDFRMGEGDRGPEGVALYPDASRLNHSCRPNAVQYFNPNTGELTIRALRDLKPGEEVFITYIPPLSSRKRRKELLRFECKCEFCFGDDALGRQLEHVVCPHCQVTTYVVTAVNKSPEDLQKAGGETTKKEGGVASLRETRCGMCRVPIPVDDYIKAVDEKKKMATDLCLQDDPNGDHEKEQMNRFKAVRFLLGIEEGASLLAPCHYKRFEVRLEALAAAVGAPMTVEVSEQIMRLAKKTLIGANDMLPSRWPLQTGLMMHYVMCYGRHFKSTINSTLDEDENEEEGSDKRFDKDGSRKKNPFMTEDICKILADAFEDHIVLTGSGNDEESGSSGTGSVAQLGAGVLHSFWKRYEMELAAIDVNGVEDFEAFMATVMAS